MLCQLERDHCVMRLLKEVLELGCGVRRSSRAANACLYLSPVAHDCLHCNSPANAPLGKAPCAQYFVPVACLACAAVSRLTLEFSLRILAGNSLGGGMPSFRGWVAALSCASLIAAPVWSAPVNALGTIVAADRAHLSDTAASPGATVFSGDRVNT